MRKIISLLKNRQRNFHVDVKGLVFDEEGKLMLLKEPAGTWDLPGGRMEHGENFEQALQRECQEELGVSCTLLEPLPVFSWPVLWEQHHIYVVYLAFCISVDSYVFKQTNEHTDHAFLTPLEMEKINLIDALHPLRDWLKQQK